MTAPRAAGRALDAEIAEKVMGIPSGEWRYRCRVERHERDEDWCYACRALVGDAPADERIPELYSTDIAAAWEVVDALGGIVVMKRLGREEWQVRFGDAPAWWGETAPLAICRAALAAAEASDA